MPSLLQDLQVPGASLALLHEGKLAWSGQFGQCEAGHERPVQANTVFEAASLSKPLFAYLVLQAVQAGQIELDRPVLDYLPQELWRPPQTGQRMITARMLLSHRSGLPNWRSAADESLQTLQLAHEPGDRFLYSGEAYFYLQRVIEHITGTGLQALAEKALFKPLGMSNSAFSLTPKLMGLRARGHDELGQVLPEQDYQDANAAYTLYTTPADYAMFVAELLRPSHDTPHALKSASIQAMLAHVTIATDREPIERPGLQQGPTVFWGLGWAINTNVQGDIAYHTGTNSTGFRNYCQFSPSRGSGFILMSNGLRGNELWRQLMPLLGAR
ncbi:serine hydrolase domain-containing protein [Roseateles sp.]|uniref:serine hydrolase domain-containing protein n=1 Tax=Roseateles sp. TaxID=1971397 RepID=UPI003BA68ECD